MLRLWQVIQRAPALLFGTAVLSAMLGFGLLFDRMADTSEVRQLAQRAVFSQDHRGLPFLVVDKVRARLFAFDANGDLLASTPVLLGASHADAPGSAATPAGRFEAYRPSQAPDGGLRWVSPNGELLLRGADSVLTPGRAMQRLASPQLEDRRISDGSLHVSPAFFQRYLAGLRTQRSVAYVLPERQETLRGRRPL